jgi:hypothetical protein
VKERITISIIFPIFAIIVGIKLNFQEFLMGSPATVKNLIVTFVYIAIWTYVLTITSKNKIMKYYSAFWLLTLLFAILTGFVNMTGANIDLAWAIPFVILLLTQWYGIELLIDNFLISSIIISSLSLLMFIATVYSLKRTK